MLQITILFSYAVAAALAGRHWMAAGDGSNPSVTRLAGLLCATGLLVHSIDLGRALLRGAGLDLSIGNIVSLIGWQIGAFALVALLRPQWRGLGALLLPLAALAALATGHGAGGHDKSVAGWALQAHIVLSLLAYAMLTLAAGIAAMMAVQNRRLRQRRHGGVLRLLPPLETMDHALFATIGAGFALLSMGLFAGLIFVDNLFAQHLTHKAVLSLVAWLVFAILLLGRWRFGWRGSRAVQWTLSGFAFLALAYFGSRIVLELLLGRQWG